MNDHILDCLALGPLSFSDLASMAEAVVFPTLKEQSNYNCILLPLKNYLHPIRLSVFPDLTMVSKPRNFPRNYDFNLFVHPLLAHIGKVSDDNEKVFDILDQSVACISPTHSKKVFCTYDYKEYVYETLELNVRSSKNLKQRLTPVLNYITNLNANNLYIEDTPEYQKLKALRDNIATTVENVVLEGIVKEHLNLDVHHSDIRSDMGLMKNSNIVKVYNQMIVDGSTLEMFLKMMIHRNKYDLSQLPAHSLSVQGVPAMHFDSIKLTEELVKLL